MLAIIRCRIFCFSIDNPKIQRQIYTTVIFLLCCVAVKLGLSHWQRTVGWGYLRIGCWGRRLGLRGTLVLRCNRDFRRMHNEELYDLYSSLNIIWMWYSKRKRWVGHEEDRREEVYVGFWWGNLRERDYLDGAGIGKRIILKWVFRK
jgi:hypothetical protein